MMEKTAWGGVGVPRAIARNHRNWTEPRRVVVPPVLSGMDVTTSSYECLKLGLSWTGASDGGRVWHRFQKDTACAELKTFIHRRGMQAHDVITAL